MVEITTFCIWVNVLNMALLMFVHACVHVCVCVCRPIEDGVSHTKVSSLQSTGSLSGKVTLSISFASLLKENIQREAFAPKRVIISF